MRLAIISDCAHVKTPSGDVGTDIHIFVRQMEALSDCFSEVHVFCPFDEYDPSTPITIYKSSKIGSFTPIKKVGGKTLLSKFQIIAQFPLWFKIYRKADAVSDIVYQRFPNNVNLPGLFYFLIVGKKVFGTYTGTWEKNKEESLSYSLVKWLLKFVFRGPVGVYSNDDSLTKRIFKSFSPSYNNTEWSQETKNVEDKLENIKKNGLIKLKLVTVGTLIGYKNQQYILDTCLLLKKSAIPFQLTIVGDGILRSDYEKFVNENQLSSEVTFAGKLNFQDVRDVYRQSDFVIQAPTSEGFGKVPIEGYFHGTLPIINNITMAEYITQQNTLGFLFRVEEKDSLFNLLRQIYTQPHLVIERVKKGREFAKQFTLEKWAREYYDKIVSFYKLKI